MRKVNIYRVEMQEEECVVVLMTFTSCYWTLSCSHVVAQVVCSRL